MPGIESSGAGASGGSSGTASVRSGLYGGAKLFATRNRPAASQQSNGTDTSATSGVDYVATSAVTDLRVVYENYLDIGVAPTNPILYRAAIEYSGTIYPLYFQGARSKTIDVYGYAVSDPLSIFIPAGATFTVRTYVQVNAAEKWNKNLNSTKLTTGSDLTANGAAALSTISSAQVPSPLAVLCGHATTWPPVTCGIVGDSINYGQTTANAENGWIEVALRTANIPSMNIARSGDTAQNLATQTSPILQNRFARLDGCKYACVLYGTNDIAAARTSAQVLADLTTIAQRLQVRGITPFVCTLPPRTTSTDSWVTTGNQTVLATESVRLAVNAGIRAGLSGYSFFYELADVFETSRDSGIWKAGYTTDGVHPTSGATTAATAFASTAATLT